MNKDKAMSNIDERISKYNTDSIRLQVAMLRLISKVIQTGQPELLDKTADYIEQSQKKTTNETSKS